jgi:7-carboxy-7-deazaguanine synthase
MFPIFVPGKINIPQYKTRETMQLPIMEQFHTIQGEGFHQGRAAYFIRLGGCDVGCVWCDVKDSWDAGQHPKLAVNEIVDEAARHAARLAVVTGGEPAMYELSELTKSLQGKGFRTHVETSGAYPLTGVWDWVCLSPKKFKPPVKEVLPLANELKIIIFNKHDLQWAESFVADVSPDCLLYLQPEWSRAEEMLPLMVDHVKQKPQWRIGIQMHKYINVP